MSGSPTGLWQKLAEMCKEALCRLAKTGTWKDLSRMEQIKDPDAGKNVESTSNLKNDCGWYGQGRGKGCEEVWRSIWEEVLGGRLSFPPPALWLACQACGCTAVTAADLSRELPFHRFLPWWHAAVKAVPIREFEKLFSAPRILTLQFEKLFSAPRILTLHIFPSFLLQVVPPAVINGLESH